MCCNHNKEHKNKAKVSRFKKKTVVIRLTGRAMQEQVRSVGELDERLRSDGRAIADDIESGTSEVLLFPHRTGLERGDHPE